MVDVGSAIVSRVGVEVYKATSPSFFRWVKNLFYGKTVLFLGPSYAGKTSYVTYLQSGELTDPSDFADRTLGHRNSGTLKIKSANGNVEIDVTKAIDTQGQAAPQEHAILILSHKPHAICLMFDGSSDWAPIGVADPSRSNKVWLEEFLIKLCQVSDSQENPLERLKSFLIILNKADLIADDNILQSRAEQVRLLVQHHLKGRLGNVAQMLSVKPMSTVKGYSGGHEPTRVSLSLFMPFIRG